MKANGERKYGYGVDVLRAWCAIKDTDKHIHVSRDQLDLANKQVKLFRDTIRLIMSHLNTYKPVKA